MTYGKWRCDKCGKTWDCACWLPKSDPPPTTQRDRGGESMIDLKIEQWQHLDQRWKSFRGGQSKGQLRMLIQALKDILPDPHVVTSADEGSTKELQPDSSTMLRADGGDIVKAAEDGAFHNRDKFCDLIRLIQAGVEAWRGPFRNHEERIKELDTSTPEKTSLVDLVQVGAKENLEAACKIDTLERKIEAVREERIVEVEVLRQEIGDLRRMHLSRMHKIEHNPDTAYAWDKEHKKKHELKPGVSVCTEGLYLGCTKTKMPVFYRPGFPGQFGNDLWTAFCPIWLRDLPFPPKDTGGEP